MSESNQNPPPQEGGANTTVSLSPEHQRLSGQLGITFIPVENGSVIDADSYTLMQRMTETSTSDDEFIKGIGVPVVAQRQAEPIKQPSPQAQQVYLAHHPPQAVIDDYHARRHDIENTDPSEMLATPPPAVTAQGYMATPMLTGAPTAGALALGSLPNIPAMTQLGSAQYAPRQTSGSVFKETASNPAYIALLGVMTGIFGLMLMIYLKGSTGARSDQSYLNRVDEQTKAVLHLAEEASRQRTTCISFNCANVGKVESQQDTDNYARNQQNPEVALAVRYLNQWRDEQKTDNEILDFIKWQRDNNNPQLPPASALASAFLAETN